jgi:hypothetical protein
MSREFVAICIIMLALTRGVHGWQVGVGYATDCAL